MIISQCNIFSKILASPVNVTVLIPTIDKVAYFSEDLEKIYKKRKFKTLYLLHGALDDANSLLRNSQIEDYVDLYQIIIVIPDAKNSFYTNAQFGEAYFDFISMELVNSIEYIFPVSFSREDRYIAGISMGGYGACKCALAYPDKFSVFGSFSGAVSPDQLEPLMLSMNLNFFRFDLIFGGVDNITGTSNDLFHLVTLLKDKRDKPIAYITCGEEDKNNFDMNFAFSAALKENNIPTNFVFETGKHDWEYWRKALKGFFEFLGKL